MSSATSFPAPILLSLRSWGSLLRGIEPITDLIEETARQGWHGAAIAEFADLGTLVEEGFGKTCGVTNTVDNDFSELQGLPGLVARPNIVVLNLLHWPA